MMRLIIIPVGAGEDGVEEACDLGAMRDWLLIRLFEIGVDLERS